MPSSPPPFLPLPPYATTAIGITAQPLSDLALVAKAQQIALQFAFCWTDAPSLGQPRLILSDDGLAWHQAIDEQKKTASEKPIRSTIDRFDVDSPAAKNRSQPIAKAVGLTRAGQRGLLILDATAGWAEDAYWLACQGCQVHAVERNPIVAALVADGLRRAAIEHPSAIGNLDYRWDTGQNLLGNPPKTPVDVVYLDPMFPVDPKRTALAKKPMRWLKEQVGDDADASELFDLARTLSPKRIVVKRPIKAPAIAPGAPDPTMVFQGRGFRFDVYVLAAI